MLKRFLTLCLILPFLAFSAVRAETAQLDLSAIDFNKSVLFDLDGNWSFAFNEYVAPEQVEKTQGFIRVPSSWNHVTNSGGGYATYAIKLKLPVNKPQLALKVMSISSAYNLYANGKLVHSVGIPGNSADEHKPAYLPGIVPLPETGQSLQLVFHVANFRHARGGIWRTIKLGNVQAVQKEFYGKLISEIFLSGALLVFGLYFLVIYVLRPANRVTFWFSFVAFMMLLRTILTEEMLLVQLFSRIPFNLQITAEYLNFILIAAGIMRYVSALYPEDVHKKSNIIWTYIFLGLLLFILVTPLHIFTRFLFTYQIILAIGGLSIIASFALSLIRGRAGARALLFSSLVLVATLIHDSLYSQGLFQSFYLTPFGFLFFVFAQAVILANKYEMGLRESEKMATELEILVDQRTKQLQQEKENATVAADAKMAFMAAMSHDIRTPLNSIIGMAQLLQGEEHPELRNEYLRRLHFSTDHLLALINEILEFNDLEKGHIFIERDKIDFHQMLADIAVTFKEQATRKNLHFSFNNDNRLPRFIYTDRIKLLRILLCLLDNAIKFTSHGYISFRTELHEKTADTAHVLLEISDTGVGISERKMSELFKSFAREGTDDHIAHKGAGLGLAISIKLANLLGGEIRARSEKYKGSIFTVYLPLQLTEPEEDTIAAATIKPELSAQILAGKKILVIDDNDENRLLARHLLRKKDILVFEAESGIRGLEILEQEQIDLVLLDMLMPDMDGIEVCRRIRSLPHQHANIPIIALTASASAKLLSGARDAGISDILLKPYKAEDLFEMITAQLHRA